MLHFINEITEETKLRIDDIHSVNTYMFAISRNNNLP